MNQYERMVSYIYQYRQNEKGANVGYVRLEKRGNTCRLSVQMRPVPINSMPKVYLYQQMEHGISKVYAGQMTVRGGSMLFKTNSSSEKVFGSEQGIEEMDGVFIDTEEEVYFASSWKNDNFYLGDRGNGRSSDTEHAKTEAEESPADDLKGDVGKEEEGQTERLEEPAVVRKTGEEKGKETMASAGSTEEQGTQRQAAGDLPLREDLPQAAAAKAETDRRERTAEDAGTQENDMQMQSICGVCPFKRKSYDYGKKILMTFPSMKPFQTGVAKACVRMELQDIGCLPIASWSLSGNRFLLHGYYCYRHLLFAQMADGRYVLGVPGIYSDREQKNACRFGFPDFQSIGDFGMQQGAFGYWLLEIPEENQRFSFK